MFVCYCYIYNYYWKCKFPMHLNRLLASVGLLAGWLFVRVNLFCGTFFIIQISLIVTLICLVTGSTTWTYMSDMSRLRPSVALTWYRMSSMTTRSSVTLRNSRTMSSLRQELGWLYKGLTRIFRRTDGKKIHISSRVFGPPSVSVRLLVGWSVG